MRIGRLLIVPFVLILAGCFQGQRTFKVNADGSGTIVDTTKLGEQAKGMLQGLEEMDKSSPAEKAAKKKAKQTEKAASMGEGVTFVSQVTAKDGSEVTTWAFKDITKVKASGMPSPDESTTSKEEPITFKLSKNAAGNTVLVVVSPPEKKADPATPAKPKKKPEEIQQEITMMKGMMAGLKIKSVVEVNGKLVKTSSPHAVGSAVTLMEMDFDALDAAALQKLSEGGPGGPPTPAMMKGIKGIKVSDPEVTIEFTGGK
jgi:hypothetical protein